ncbi:unnamed protein product, partial [Ectocarpus sp. 12 AP-2014]
PFRVNVGPSESVIATLDPFRAPPETAVPCAAPAAALLSLTDHRIDPTRVEQRLALLFGLTGAEQRLVLGLADDRSLTELADDTGLSIHTLRSQLKAVYAKTGLKRQSQLAGLVQRLT